MRLTGRHTVTLRSAEPEFRYRLFTAAPADTGAVRLDPV
jgi:hypothetical protein